MPKQKLSVRPIKRAYQPKYPSYVDPNPIDHPETRPYPFSQKMIDALGKAGFVGALMLSPLAGDAQTEEVRSENPFPVAYTNLPYVPISYGTGQPSRLSREDVTDFIHQVFVKEGLQPKRDQLVTADSLRITANSYDESCNIGFIWLDHTNFGPGMRREHFYDWRATARSQEQEREITLKGTEQEYLNYQRDTVRYLSRLVNDTYHNRPIDHDLQRDFTEKLPMLTTAEAQEKYFVERLADFRYLEHLDRYQKLEGYEVYVTLLETIGTNVSDPIERYALAWRTNLIATFLSTKNTALTAGMEAELEKIGTLTGEDWTEALEWLITFTQLDGRRRYLGRNPSMEEQFAAVLNANTVKERARKYVVLTTIIDEQEISLAEARKLEEAAVEGEHYIAPISIFDHRTIYHSVGSYEGSEEIEQQLNELREKVRNAATKEEQKSLRETYSSLSTEHYTKKTELGKLKALQRLEEEVKAYIHWAKAQQGY